MPEETPLDPDRKTLFLLDGYALIYRAFFAMIGRPLTTSSGENTSAPYGIARFLLRVLDDYSPDFIGVVFDAGDSFRTELLEEYKATRAKMPDELQASLPRCRAIIEGFRVPVIEAIGWEADDVIGTLSARARQEGLQTVIVSGDKDFYQLVDSHTLLLNPGRGGPAGVDQEWVTVDNARERLGVDPRHVTDLLALLGDSSDNVPGVRGVGRKTAPGLIERFGSVEDILGHLDEIETARVRRCLEEGEEAARLSKQLVTIRTDVPVELELERLRREPPDSRVLRDLFLELEFNNLLRELAMSEEPAAGESTYELVLAPHRAAEVAETLEAVERLAIHTLGSSPDPMRAELVGLALAGEPGQAYYLPFGHRPPQVARDEAGNPTLALEQVEVSNLPPPDGPELSPLRRLLESEVPKVSHDTKYDLLLLERAGVRLRAIRFDTSISSYCLDPSRREHTLDLLGLDRLGRQLTPAEQVVGAGRSAVGFDEAPQRGVSAYACERADVALQLAASLEEELRERESLDLFERIEMPLVPVLAAMERNGIAIDLVFFGHLQERLERELTLVREEIHKLAGEEVNLRSVPQMRELLFEKLELPVIKKTKTGPSTDESVLASLAAKGHEVPRLILEYRELDKLNSTYVSKLPQLVNPDTGRIHTNFNQTVTATGRLSSSDPNLQNIPIRSSLGREIRKGFVPGSGFLFVAADYSQIELRVMAHLSGDSAFVEAFRADRDIHRETASRIFGVESERVTAGMRGQAKTINFATIYGQGPVALAAQLGISRAEAREFIDQYFERFSGVGEYLEAMKEQAREQGYVETLSGRRRYIPEIRSRNPGIRGFGERTATNSPIQGSAADLIKVAMIRLHGRLADREARMVLQVHDELLFEVAENDVDSVTSIVREEMEGAIELDVPLRVDLGVGASWYDCKPA